MTSIPWYARYDEIRQRRLRKAKRRSMNAVASLEPIQIPPSAKYGENLLPELYTRVIGKKESTWMNPAHVS